jgi:hypothetical protein
VELRAQPATKLPPKKPKDKTERQLGESEAVKEVQRLTQESTESTEISGAVPPVSISSDATDSLVHSKKKEEEEQKEEEQKKEGSKTSKAIQAKDLSAQKPPPSRLWLVLDKKPEFGFSSGWVFTRKELAKLVGGAWSYGFIGAQEFQPNIQAQVRLSGSHHRKSDSFRKSSLNLFPIDFLLQFSRKMGPFKIYVQPGLGAAAWFAKSERLVDSYVQKSKGFDFMASGGIGAQYLLADQPWRYGAEASLSYVSGYFDNYFTRVLVYTSYQF